MTADEIDRLMAVPHGNPTMIETHFSWASSNWDQIAKLCSIILAFLATCCA